MFASTRSKIKARKLEPSRDDATDSRENMSIPSSNYNAKIDRIPIVLWLQVGNWLGDRSGVSMLNSSMN